MSAFRLSPLLCDRRPAILIKPAPACWFLSASIRCAQIVSGVDVGKSLELGDQLSQRMISRQKKVRGLKALAPFDDFLVTIRSPLLQETVRVASAVVSKSSSALNNEKGPTAMPGLSDAMARGHR
jgi:hypothetical protein